MFRRKVHQTNKLDILHPHTDESSKMQTGIYLIIVSAFHLLETWHESEILPIRLHGEIW